MKAGFILATCGLATSLMAQPSGGSAQEGARFALEREQLNVQRQALALRYAENKRMCWQRFAVNDCLRQARRDHHAALTPLRAQVLALDEQEREWRSRQREERLLGKQQGASPP